MNRRILRQTKRGSEFVEAALCAPILLTALFILVFLVRLDLIQEARMYDLAKATEKTMLPNYVSYEVDVPIPFFERTLKFHEYLVTHPFTGEKPEGEGLGTRALEEDGDTVWVFPRRGERFHTKECRIVTVYPFEMILTASLKKKYEPCSNCHPETLIAGTPVYVFRTGNVYHRKSCASVTRYVVSMAKQQAKEEGYLPCSYCSTN